MIDRYTRPEMAELWSEEAQFDAWLEVEIAAAAAWSKLGVIPAEDVEKIREKATFNIDRIHEIEEITRHDVVAFTRSVSESLGDERKWVHYGLTSSDVVDTAWSVRLKKANALILEQIDRMIAILGRRADEHRHTLVMGRTHGVHAEPTTFGVKLALYYDEMRRNRKRFVDAAEAMRVGKVSGSVGTFAHLPMEVEQYTCEFLGLEPAPVSTQVLQRDRHAFYMATLAVIGGTLEKMAVEVRGLQKSEVREVEEAFRKGQKGSSSMPHKRNPVTSENITGCARMLRGYMVTAYENMPLWHERDISHSSAERVILPDATTILHYALSRFAGLMDNLVVFDNNMRRNMQRTFGLYNSQRVLNALIEKGLMREDAYDRVQPCAMQAWETEEQFKDICLENDGIREHLSAEEIEACFDDEYHLKRVDAILARVGL
jgi:adenylosuccinate lyase